MEQKMTKKHLAVIVGVALTCFVQVSLCSTLWGLYIVPITEELGVSRASVSLIFTFQGLMGMLLSLFAFKILKKVKIKTLYIIGGPIVLLSLIIMGTGKSMIMINLGAFLNGVGSFTHCYLTGGTLIAKWFNKSRGTMTGIMGAAGSLGAVLLSPILSNVIANYGWRVAIIGSGVVICVVVVICGLFLITDNPEMVGLKAFGSKMEDTEVQAESGVVKRDVSGLTLNEAKKTGAFYAIIGAGLLATIALMCISTHQSAMIMDKGFTLEQAATVVSVYSLAGLLNKLVSGVVTDKFGLRVTCWYCGAAFIIAALLMLFSNSYGSMFVFAALCGCWTAIISSFPLLANTHVFGNKEIGAIQGFSSTAGSAGGMIGPTIAGILYTMSGSYSVVLTIAIVMVVIFLVMATVLLSPKNAIENTIND